MEKKLKQFNDLQQEIKRYETKLRMLDIEFDKVYGSDSEFPYVEKSFNLHGENAARKKQKKKRYEHMLEKCTQLENEIEEWIMQIPDSATRLVFSYRYVDKLSWREIGRKLNRSESYVRYHVHDYYLNNCGLGGSGGF